MGQQCCYLVEFLLGLLAHIAFVLGRGAQLLHELFADFVIFETRRIYALLKIGIERIGNLERGNRAYFFIGCRIAGGIVEYPVVGHKVINEPVDRAPVHRGIGTQTSAVANLAAMCRLIYVGKAVGDAGHRPVGIPTRIIYGLDEPSGGEIVFGYRHLQQAAVGQLRRILHESLSIAARSYQHRAVQILKRAGHDFRRGGAPSVDENSKGRVGEDGRPGCFVDALLRGVAADGAHYLGAFGHEIPCDVNGSLHESATVAPKVDHNPFQPFILLEFIERLAHFAGRLVDEARYADIAYPVDNRIISHARLLHLGAHYLHHFNTVGGVWPLHRHFHRSAGHSLQQFGHEFAPFIGHIHAVDAQYMVAGTQSPFGRGTPLHRLGYVGAAVALHDITADAAVFAGGELLKLLLIFGGVILGVGIGA